MSFTVSILLLVSSFAATLAKEESCLADEKGVPISGAAQVQTRAMQMAPCPCDQISHLFDDPNNLVNHTGSSALMATGSDTSPPTDFCEPFCVDNGCPCLKPWADRCMLKSCSMCPECAPVNPTPPPPPVYPTPPPVYPTPPPVYPTQPPPPCTNGKTKITMSESNLAHNNLAGVGPDNGEEEMRWSHVGAFDGKDLDLVVTATDASHYKLNDKGSNGQKGVFGKINIKGGHKITVQFQIQDGEHNPVALPEVHFSILDLDETQTGNNREFWTIRSAGPINLAFAGTEVHSREISEHEVELKSMMWGQGCDNPEDPMKLGVISCKKAIGVTEVDQRKRSAMVALKDVSEFTVDLESTCTGQEQCDFGRNFLFTWSSELEDQCQ